MKKGKTMKKGKSKKALMTALAFAVGASAPMAGKASQDGLFNINEIGSQPVLIAEEGKCGGKDGKCGSGMKDKEGKCGVKKMMRKMFGKDKKAKKGTTTKAKARAAEAKCGEGMCGSGEKKK